MNYQLTHIDKFVQIVGSDAFIPPDPSNTDYAAYLTWLAEDNTPEPYIPPSIDYRDARASEYPPITDYLDAIVKSDSEALNKYISDCNAVKQKYPKPDQPIMKKSKRIPKGTK